MPALNSAGMGSVYFTGLSALNGYSSAIDTVANNLANMQTTGYKSSDVDFNDLVASEMDVGSATTGQGIANPQAVMQFVQGGIQSSQSPLDCALSGSGFFVTDNSKGQAVYTRDGSFQVGQDASGDPILVSSSGNAVQGYAATANGFSATNAAIALPDQRAATATTQVEFSGNLDAGTAAGGQTGFPVTVYDASGAAHAVSLQFTKQAPGSWTLNALVDGVPSGSAALQFDNSGNLSGGASSVTLSVAGQPVTITSSTLTQLGTATTATAISQNGSPQATVTGYEIGNDGIVYADTADDGEMAVAKLALANVQNPQSLLQTGSGDFSASATTMTPTLGTAQSLGVNVMSHATEASTTDIAAEFGNLIQYQRAYEMNGKAITTGDQMRQDLLNLIQ